MENVKHTPGPWVKFVSGFPFSATGPTAAAVMIAKDAIDKPIDDVTRDYFFVVTASSHLNSPAIALGYSAEDAEYHARLIAAAPETAAERDKLREINAELLEALRPFANGNWTTELAEKARATYIKATGGA